MMQTAKTGHWAGAVAALGVFAAGAAAQSVIINELHVDPDVKTEPVEYIELYNRGPAADLGGWKFDRGVDFTFPPGTVLASNAYLVVAANPAAVMAKFGVSALGPFEGTLANEGEEVRLVNGAGATVDKVDYGVGFPWPVVGEPPGYSMELVNPGLDNDLGGHWRPSISSPAGEFELVPASNTVAYFKGYSEASTPRDAWRATNFNSSGWLTGSLPIGYGESFVITPLDDMQGNYRCFFVRREFVVADASDIQSVELDVRIDDGLCVWINGEWADTFNMPSNDPLYTDTASQAKENLNWQTLTLSGFDGPLRNGTNVLCVQVHNSSLGNSTDCVLDMRLRGRSGGSSGPSPGRRNTAYAAHSPPALRQVDHTPEQPASGQPVVITVKATDINGVTSVVLDYQAVAPGAYVSLTDAAYTTGWTTVTMHDDGLAGDAAAGDAVYSVTLPGAVQVNRTLVRYRIRATDGTGLSVQAPFGEDPCPNFAYFVYDGIPAWSGAVKPGDAGTNGVVVTFPTNITRSLPAYHLISKKTDVENATWFSRYGGEDYLWTGALVYDGEVYDHIRYRARGGVWRYAMIKNMWKFDFNRTHDLKVRDNYGEAYPVRWRKLNLGASIQQGDFWHRGEQGMFESVGFELFNLVGVASPHTQFVQFRVIDESGETGTTQYDGDFWGLYLATEQQDGRLLDQHGLPDGNLYKMEGGTGELNNQGPTAVTDKSDLNTFLNTYQNTTPDDAWWRANLDLDRYYSYRAVVEAIHHFDIGDGKNYFYYLNPTNAQWQVMPWDLDLTWADNMYGSGAEPFRDRVLPRAAFNLEYKNRLREFRDLLYNTGETWRFIDDLARLINDPAGGLSFVDMDRMRWDYNPIMDNGAYSSSIGKALTGRFYSGNGGNIMPPTPTFEGMVQKMKNYVVTRSVVIDSLASDSQTPTTPTATYTGPDGWPVNALSFRSSSFSDTTGSFGAMEWRIGEITDTNAPCYDVGDRPHYEITAVWESGEIATYTSVVAVPPSALRSGHTYRLRVRHRDNTGRWSHWSPPVQFTAGEASNAQPLLESLRITEVMFNPAGGGDYEFIEFFNRSATNALDLGGVLLSEGVEYAFPAGTTLAPGAYVLVARAPGAAFNAYYGLTNVTVLGPFAGGLSDSGDRIRAETAGAGTEIADFTYGDGRGWPAAADGAGHSLVPLLTDVQTDGRLDLPFHWRASAYLRGSPGAADPEPPEGVVINEFAAHTDYSNPAHPEYDSNDWIELFNRGSQAVSLGDFYLSDDPAEPDKWAVPFGVLSPGGRVSYDEVTGFHSPITSGFGLDKAGEQVLLSHLPGGAPGRVVDVIRFEGQPNGRTTGRYPDGADDWRLMPPTRDAANRCDGPPEIVIREMVFHPVGGTNALEYIELFNPSATGVTLETTQGTWRLAGGIDFVFAPGTVIPGGGSLLVVSFDPADAAARSAFLQAYGLSGDVALAGPFGGQLSNTGERISLEYPLEPDLPDTTVPWVIVDEVYYGLGDPWPEGMEGQALHRVDAAASGTLSSNWWRFAPSPASRTAPPWLYPRGSAPPFEFEWTAATGAAYIVEQTTDLVTGAWGRCGQVLSPGPVWYRDADSAVPRRFFRVRVVE